MQSQFDLKTMYLGMSLQQWIEQVHIEMCAQYKFEQPFAIEPNDFGYDSYAVIIQVVLAAIRSNKIIIGEYPWLPKALEDAHSAWSQNYIRWKHYYLHNAHSYEETINTHRRNNEASSPYQFISDESKKMYNCLISIVLKIAIDLDMRASINDMKI